MNKIDKKWYGSLKFLSKWTLNDAFDKLKKEDLEKFKQYLQGEPWNSLHELGYVTTINTSHQIVTPSGMQELRMLEEIRRKDFTLIASAVAVIISLVALGISIASFFTSA